MRGIYQPDLGIFVCKDIGFDYTKENQGWQHCLVDKYEFGLVDGGNRLTGNYISTACRDSGRFMLERDSLNELSSRAGGITKSSSPVSPPARLISTSALPAAPVNLKPSDIALRAFKSTVVVVAALDNHWLSQGSGFVVNNGLVVTNYHLSTRSYQGMVSHKITVGLSP